MNNTYDVKNLNVSGVLDCIQKHNAISKGNIAKELGITTVTSHKLITELCEVGMCRQTGDFVSYGGRKAALYSLNPDFGAVIGVTLRLDKCVVCTSDFGFGLLGKQESHINTGDVDATISQITKMIRKSISRYCAGRRIIGISVSIPGRAAEDGHVIDIPNYPQWSGVHLADVISNEFDCPSHLDNDANALALAVGLKGMARSCKSYVAVWLDKGLGVGVVNDGVLFRGSNCHGSEIGHIIMDPEGAPCACGRQGCLQTYMDEEKVLERLRKVYGESLTFEQALVLLKDNDETARKEFDRYIKYLRIAIDNVITIFDPEMIFLKNRVVDVKPSYLRQLQTAVFPERSNAGNTRPTVVLVQDERAIELAANCIMIDKVIKDPLSFL